MKIGLISDTHGIFGQQFRDFFEPCDEIWHAGDMGGGFATAAEIAAFKPLVGVIGNCDDRRLIFDYPIYRYFKRENTNILMMHIGGFPGHYDAHARKLIEGYKPDLFVCGHSHILRVMHDDRYDMLVMNPGAAGLQGAHVLRTALRFDIGRDGLSNLEVLKVER